MPTLIACAVVGVVSLSALAWWGTRGQYQGKHKRRSEE